MSQYLWPFGNKLAPKALPDDPTSQANWKEVASQHLDFQWYLDFDGHKIHGSVTHTMTVLKSNLDTVVFDTGYLEVQAVTVGGATAQWKLGTADPVMGSALIITLPTAAAAGSTISVKIQYNTTPECKALGWLTKEQTMGGKHPYVFSQCEPIYMRTMAPCQDTPSIKATYSASVNSELPALMSALRVSPPVNGKPHDGKVVGKDRVTYIYNQPIAIPSYLIALAAGDVVYKQFPDTGENWTSGVWTEPSFLDKAYHEFVEDTTKFLKTEEAIVTPYRFGVYDLLVLPYAFPYGGMENCCLTFVTPAIVVGDRALVDVVVHELTHSWFGNSITHANASHFWLNEGWTTYMERVLQEKIHDPAERGFSYIIGRKQLDDALKDYENTPKYQRLVIPFNRGENPDDAYSVIPYEKGSNFLLHLERTLGGLDVFLPYVKNYVETFTGQSITTDTWKDHLYDYFRKNGGSEKIAALDSVKWDAWLNGEGLDLPDTISYDKTKAQPAYDLAARWDQSRGQDPTQVFTASDISGFESNQTTVFLQTLANYPTFAKTHIDALASIYDVDTSPNVEISWPFYQLALQGPKSEAATAWLQHALDWVVGKSDNMVKGRMKYNRPIFQAAAKVNRDVTVEWYCQYRNVFHPIAQDMLDKDLGLTNGCPT